MPFLNVSLVVAMETRAKQSIRVVSVLFYSTQNYTLKMLGIC